jgi:ribosomal protein S18 acetylase RimI-like enzyme
MLPKMISLKNGKKAVIRPLQKEDLEDIWTVFNIVVAEKKFIPVVNPVTSRFEKENWYFRQKEDDNIVIVSEEEEGHVVGQCMIEHVGWDAAYHIGDLGIIVSPEYRDVGLGRFLIEEAVSVAREKGFEKICLSVFHTNTRAISLYKKMGFRKVGYRDRQFKLNGDYYDEILMDLSLKDK